MTEEKKQAIPDGTRVIFNWKDVTGEDEWDLQYEEAKNNNGKEAIATLGMAAELGQGKDYEYYDLKFDNGDELAVVNGYCIDLIPEFADNGKRFVFALCTETGEFEDLIHLCQGEIIVESTERDNNGVYYLEFLDGMGQESQAWFLQKIEVL